MKKILLKLALLIVLVGVMSGRPGMAQQQGRPSGRAAMMPKGKISGTVIDASAREAMPSATISVWRAADSTLVTGAVTDGDGAFAIEGLRGGRYYVNVSFVGFATATIDDVVLSPGALTAALGDIALSPDTAVLDGVEVTAERAVMEIAIDRTVYNVKDQPITTGGSVSDLLQNIPSVDVDAEGNVSLRGSQNVAIQLNGRPVPVSGAMLAGLLQQLPANAIERVEVIPNPSAKYDPDGMSGILNIITKKDTELGLNGGVTIGLATGDKYNASGNINYQKGRVNLFANYGFRYDSRDTDGTNFRENRLFSAAPYLEQAILGTRQGTSHLLNTSLDYRLGEKRTLSLSGLLSSRNGENDGSNAYSIRDLSRSLTERYNRDNLSEADGLNAEMSLFFEQKFDREGHELSAELSHNRSNNGDFQTFTQQAYMLDGTPANDTPGLQHNDLDARTDRTTFQVDYVRPMGERTKIEAGYKGTLRLLDNDFQSETFDYGQGVFVPDVALNNRFQFDEQVHAVYGLFGQNLGRFDAQLGVRLEQALTTFDLETTDETFDNDYFSVFPSAFLTYSVSETQKVKASYSKRINRPRTWALNPFTTNVDPLNLRVGNPHLNPEYVHAFELGFSQFWQWGSMNVSPYFRRTVDVIERHKIVDSNGVSTITFANFDQRDSYGMELIGTLRLGRRFTMFASFNAYKVVTDGSNVETDLSNDAWGWMSRFNATFQVRDGLDLQWSTFYRAPLDIAQGRISSVTMSNLAVRQKLLADKASVSLRLGDVFDTMGFSFKTNDGGFYQESERAWESQVVHLSFTFNFGQAGRSQRRQRRNAEGMDQGPEEIGIE